MEISKEEMEIILQAVYVVVIYIWERSSRQGKFRGTWVGGILNIAKFFLYIGVTYLLVETGNIRPYIFPYYFLVVVVLSITRALGTGGKQQIEIDMDIKTESIGLDGVRTYKEEIISEVRENNRIIRETEKVLRETTNR